MIRAGWRNPAQQKRSSLQRVAYHLEEKTLMRSYWRVLDQAQDSRPIRMDLLNEVDEIKLRYLDERLRWHEQWPPLDLLDMAPNQDTTLKAIEVTLNVVGWGHIIRLFGVPGT